LVSDEGAVGEFVAAALDPSLHNRLHPRNADTAEDDLDACNGEDGVEPGGNFPSRSRIRKRAELLASSSSMTRVFAAWVTHEAVGCAVALRMRIRRLVCSMTANTYRRMPVRVKVSKKSHASRASACAWRKSDQVVEVRLLAGSIPASWRTCQTVEGRL